jgi:hypothetical protein
VPLYVLNRTYVLRSLNGHTINFTKGEPVWVPPVVEKEALHIGAVPVDGPKDLLDPEVEPEVVLQAGERKEKILAAFVALEKRNERGDFTGQGLPSAKALEQMTGLKVETKERDAMWLAYKQGDE